VTAGSPTSTGRRVHVRCALCGWERDLLLGWDETFTLRHFCALPTSVPFSVNTTQAAPRASSCAQNCSPSSRIRVAKPRRVRRAEVDPEEVPRHD